MTLEQKPIAAAEPPLECGVMPVAWAVFATNGNIRLWTRDGVEAYKFAISEGLKASPLYALTDEQIAALNEAGRLRKALRDMIRVYRVADEAWNPETTKIGKRNGKLEDDAG